MSINCEIVDALIAIRSLLTHRGQVVDEFCLVAEMTEMKQISIQSPERIADAVSEALASALHQRLRGMPPSGGLNNLVPYDCATLGKPVPVGREKRFTAVDLAVLGKRGGVNVMPMFRVTGGNVTVEGRKHRNGTTIEFDGSPVPVGLAPLDAAACRLKFASITDDELAKAYRFPQRVRLLAESLGEDGATPDRARRSIREWMIEQRYDEAALMPSPH